MKSASILGRQPATAVGRESHVRLGIELLGEGELITLVGVGGVGKTTLAAEIAHEADADFERLVVLELAAATDELSIRRILATALSLDVSSSLEELVGVLSARSTLLVIDNCEHVLDEAAQLCDALRASSGRVAILATSRRPLGRANEQLINLPPLDIPRRAADFAIESSTAGQLFIERVRRLLPDFEVTSENRRLITEICVRTSGIPLVIELAAALVRSRTLKQIAEALSVVEQDLVPVAVHGRPERHWSVAASVDWSLQFLDTISLDFLGRLSVFPAGFSPEDASAVAPAPNSDHADALACLDILVDHSLVHLTVDTQRYSILDVIRHAVLARLTPSQVHDAREAASRRFLAISSAIAREQYDADPTGSFRRFDHDLSNLAHAAQHCDEAGDVAGVRALVGPIATWWVHRIPVDSPHWWARNFGIGPSATPDNQSCDFAETQSVVLTAASVWFSHQGNESWALQLAQQARRCGADEGDARRTIISTIVESNSELAMGNTSAATELLLGVLAEAAEHPFPYGELLARINMARVCNSSERREHLDRALELAGLGFQSLEGVVYAELGLLALCDGNKAAAMAHAERGLQSAQSHGYSEGIGSALCGLGEICTACGDYDRAADLFGEALEVAIHSSHHGLRERAEDGLAGLKDATPSPMIATEFLIEQLSERELSVARLLRGDLTQREIGEELYIAPSTVKTHIKSIYRKLGVSKRSHAITRAAELGLFGENR